MSSGGLFVVTVASEKGGVGKTTVATNLAVYLKALREDLPVSIASFDNHFTVESMFAIGGRRGRSVAELFADGPCSGDLLQMGEYGVQFMASEHALPPPDDDPRRLSCTLESLGLSGILILDTRPVLDYFTRNALLAADLVLVPVKDRPSLVNAASIYRTLSEVGEDTARIWLLPSLIDRRLRLRDQIGMAEFLTFAARERGYQVLDIALAKSPRVEALTTSFTSRVHPVITHACGTAVHRQMRDLATFVLARRDAAPPTHRQAGSSPAPGGIRLPRLSLECPLCGARGGARNDLFFQSLPSRRYGFLHAACFAPFARLCGAVPGEAELLAIRFEGAGFSWGEESFAWYLYDGAGTRLEEGREDTGLRPLVEGVGGAPLPDLGRQGLLVCLTGGEAGVSRLRRLRRGVLGDLALT